VSFGIAGMLVALIRRPEPDPEAKADRLRMRSQLREGISFVFRQPYLRVLTLCTASWNLFISITFSIYLVFVVRELGLSAGIVGVLFMVGNLGTLAGAFLSARIARRFGIGPTIAGAALVASVAGLAIPLAPQSRPVPVLLIGLIGFSFAAIVFNINQLTLRQTITPQRMLGRMNSVVRFMYWSTSPAGFLLGGALATWIGLRPTLWIGTVGALVAFLPIFFSSLVRLRVLPDGDEADREAPRAASAVVPVVDA
jgi:predicted MFS family arabinose efflux permease